MRLTGGAAFFGPWFPVPRRNQGPNRVYTPTMNVGDWICRTCGTINATGANRCLSCERERGTPTLVDKTAMFISVVLAVAILAAIASALGTMG